MGSYQVSDLLRPTPTIEMLEPFHIPGEEIDVGAVEGLVRQFGHLRDFPQSPASSDG